MRKQPIVLIHKSECSGTYRNHFAVCQDAFGNSRCLVWDGESPLPLAGHTVLKLGNSCFLGSEAFERLGDGLAKAEAVAVASDDYLFPSPTQVRNVLRDHKRVALLSNCPSLFEKRNMRSWDWYDRFFFLNWNKSSWQESAPFSSGGESRFSYYGSFRPKREAAFKRWFAPNGIYPFVALSSSRGAKWEAINPGLDYLGKLTLDQLTNYSAAIYLQDSAQPYHCPANRFYEMLCRRIPMAFDSEAGLFANMDTAGYDIRKYVVGSRAEAEQFLKRTYAVRAEQNRLWRRDYRSELITELRNTMKDFMS